ncbi:MULTISPECIES: hypothetical protein [unclassified Lentimonas]|uniref:hypothetical protein n=1 Tax=unclassified Lentimonas TaxID=2630993 RepID=UPI001324B6EC|nr:MULTISPECIES: hypothetical protein [unclassified Lentimonas]CAA6678388.1 Unannotated [Lentimonas sp. CC4]CAA6685480.1 Unannotated [Lentimonas sp. CC6]CAA6690535.1 Unannotated [Lentimonas sp. CC10]CAA6693302.1 Unannotated [Lentimonas sp. CC19]CAA7068792.1 Unannotated [Lentimonas sp. CC11]
MYSLLISALVALAVASASIASQFSTGTTVFFSLVGFTGTFFLVGFLVRKKMSKAQGVLQESMEAAQRRMQRKVQQFQNKPGGNIKQIQSQLEMDQKAMCKQGLELTKGLEPFRNWSLLTGRQIATMRLQFNYQLKEFDKVDEILATCGFLRGPMMMEPMAVAMRMARCYKNDDLAGAKKVFKRKILWFRGDRGTLLYGLMSWIYVKAGKPDEARQVLLKAKEATGVETFTKNWDHLTNDRAKSFSNAGLGDEWYSLHLENPPMVKQQRKRGNGRNPRGF